MTMLDELREAYRQQSRVRLAPFMEGPQVDEFHRLLVDATWFQRRSRLGRLDCLAPAEHGLITGRMNEFLSQPAVMQNLGAITTHECAHFVGNIVRRRADQNHRFEWRGAFGPELCAALCINLGPAALAIGDDDNANSTAVAPGDACLMDLSRTHVLQSMDGTGLFIEGLLVRR